MLIQRVISKLIGQPAKNAVGLMRMQFNNPRGGNADKHDTFGTSKESIEASTPVMTASTLTWDFKAADSAIRLNTGGSNKMGIPPTDVPYGDFRAPGGKSAYISALKRWVKKKYGLSGEAGRRVAFAIAQAASNRGRTVKHPGWFDEIEEKVFRQIMADIQALLMVEINTEINNMLKGNK